MTVFHSPNARVIALDVGGTSIKSVIVAPGGRLVGKPAVTSIDSAGDAETILAGLVKIVRNHLADVEPSQLLGAALGFPGPFDYPRAVCLISGVNKYEALYGINLREALQSRLGLGDLDILFRNDAEAAVIGEARYGSGRPYSRLIGITLGTGCGSAFVVNGVPVRGGRGVPPNGWLYPERFRGRRADDVFSRRGLEARLREAGVSAIDIKDAATAARGGDRAAHGVFETFGSELGQFLNPYAIAFQAEAVLALGQIAQALDLFGAPLGKTLSVNMLAGERGAEAALLGAADLLFNPQSE